MLKIGELYSLKVQDRWGYPPTEVELKVQHIFLSASLINILQTFSVQTKAAGSD